MSKTLYLNLITLQASENLFYTAQHKWLIIETDNSFSDYKMDNITNDNRINTIMALFDNLNISVDADIIVCVPGKWHN